MVVFGIPRRVIVPEILDSLPSGDPRAQRSRKDLELLDLFLGNSRWVVRTVGRLAARGESLGEIGAGGGGLAGRLARSGYRVHAMDLVGPPSGLSDPVTWRQGDFFETLPYLPATTLVGSLILHHFHAPDLLRLGGLLGGIQRLVFTEPLRSALPFFLSQLASPFVGEVTRHDMPASIRAGFLPGELAPALGLGPQWKIFETGTLRGTLRFVACRN